MTYTWQSVTKNIQMDDLAIKLDRRLDKIKTQLLHFPQDSVHLNISLEKNTKKDLFTAALTLHVPSNILHAEKSASHLLTAFDNAADTLVREIQSLKADLRGEYRWEQSGRRAALHEGKLTRFGGLPPEVDMDVETETVAEMIDEHRNEVRDYVNRQVERDERSGRIPSGEIDVENIITGVRRRAMVDYKDKPQDQTYKVWFYLLARDEMTHQYRQLRPPQPGPATPRPIERKYNPPAKEPLSRLLPDMPPEAQAELLNTLHDQLTGWPEEEHCVFDLRFLEGFTPEEIAVIMRTSTDHITDVCRGLESRIREMAGAVK